MVSLGHWKTEDPRFESSRRLSFFTLFYIILLGPILVLRYKMLGRLFGQIRYHTTVLTWSASHLWRSFFKDVATTTFILFFSPCNCSVIIFSSCMLLFVPHTALLNITGLRLVTSIFFFCLFNQKRFSLSLSWRQRLVKPSVLKSSCISQYRLSERSDLSLSLTNCSSTVYIEWWLDIVPLVSHLFLLLHWSSCLCPW